MPYYQMTRAAFGVSTSSFAANMESKQNALGSTLLLLMLS